jgi:hypothetical protein
MQSGYFELSLLENAEFINKVVRRKLYEVEAENRMKDLA